jgi:hypothetical protein
MSPGAEIMRVILRDLGLRAGCTSVHVTPLHEGMYITWEPTTATMYEALREYGFDAFEPRTFEFFSQCIVRGTNEANVPRRCDNLMEER